jgi:hypothetical protein
VGNGKHDMKEVWKDILGYKGIYQASDQGRIKSLSRLDSRGHKIKGRILKPVKEKDNYLHVTLCKNGKIKRRKIHHLILETFVGLCPDGMECCHNINNRQNNRLSNLRWDTKSSNSRDSIRDGTHVDNSGEKNGSSKLTYNQILTIRRLYKTKYNQKELSNKFNISQSQISKIINFKLWRI